MRLLRKICMVKRGRRPCSSSGNRGFTLLELLISLSLLALIVVIMMGAMRISSRSVTVAERKMDAQERFRTVLAVMDAQIQSHVPLTYEEDGNKKYYLTKQTKGSILKIPFENKSFDVVVCTDVLEHINPRKQDKAINELLRITKKNLYISVPTGKESLDQDFLLNKIYKNKYAKNFPFLGQHLSHGLPDANKIQNQIMRNALKLNKKITIKEKGNENLQIRLFLMRGWITKNIITDLFFRKIMLFFLPVIKALEHPPYYRTLFFVTIES